MTTIDPGVIRIGIPLLRILSSSWFRALFIVSTPGWIVWAEPLQKQFVVPLSKFIWSVLALTPFVVLRLKWVYYLYTSVFIILLAVLAYDYWIPFRYVAPGYSYGDSPATISIDGNITYWVTLPTIPIWENWEDCLLACNTIFPLALAYVYGQSFHAWTTKPNKSE